MVNRNNVHIVRRNNGWGILWEGGRRVTQVFDIQAQAIQAERRMAREDHGEMLARGQNGRLCTRDLHGSELFPPGDSK